MQYDGLCGRLFRGGLCDGAFVRAEGQLLCSYRDSAFPGCCGHFLFRETPDGARRECGGSVGSGPCC